MPAAAFHRLMMERPEAGLARCWLRRPTIPSAVRMRGCASRCCRRCRANGAGGWHGMAAAQPPPPRRDRRRAGAGRNIEYLFYQTLIGAWPLGLEPGDTSAIQEFAERDGSLHDQSGARGQGEFELEATRTRPMRRRCSVSCAACSTQRGRTVPCRFRRLRQRAWATGGDRLIGAAGLETDSAGHSGRLPGGESWDLDLVDPDNSPAGRFRGATRAAG